jgi:2-iminobutanoate/2-iminopropanoate deaminase
MPKQVIKSDKAPKPAGPYSQGILAEKFLFVAGQIGTDPKTGKLPDGVGAQTKQTLENIKAIVEAAGASLDNVVRVGVYLTDIKNFSAMNEVYKTYFTQNEPARSTIQAALVGLNLVEIDCIVLTA